MMSKSVYQVTGNIRRDGVSYSPDGFNEITLPDDIAERMLSAKNPPIRRKNPVPTVVEEGRQPLPLTEAFDTLVAEDPRDEEKWAGSKPKTSSLEALTGQRISAKDRDEAWSQYEEYLNAMKAGDGQDS